MTLLAPTTTTDHRGFAAVAALALVVTALITQPASPAETPEGEPAGQTTAGQANLEREFEEDLERELAQVGPETSPVIAGPRDLFDLLGIDQSHFDLLTDRTAWREGEDEILLKSMYRLHRSFRPINVESWSLGEAQPIELAEDPEANRGEIFRLTGRVTSVETLRPIPEVRERFELSHYYRCEILLGPQRQPAVLFARTIPEAWKSAQPIDARASAFAVFLKLGSDDVQRPSPVFVTSRVAWHPPTQLGDLDFDVGLLDDLHPRQSAGEQQRQSPRQPERSRVADLQLTGRNRECFYQMLAAAGRTAPGELAGKATDDLRQTGRDRFSVVPLFNDPVDQRGRLVVLSGTARQVLPVRVSDEDVLSRFGIDRYYQVFLFTEDSQSNPLVFCVRELPEGMPIGEGAQFGEPVTVAGFFFNTWAYRNRRLGVAATSEDEWQLAPLLIGRDLQWRGGDKPASNPYLGAIAGGLFVVALLGVWLALLRYSRGDKEFREKTIAPQFALDSGMSLDNIGLDADGKPDFSGLDEASESD